MNEELFLLITYMSGFSLALASAPRLPVIFSCLSGLMWGILLWVITALTAILVGAHPLIPILWGSLCALLILRLLWLFYRDTTLRAPIIIAVVVAVIVVWLLAGRNVTIASFDSLSQIIIGRTFIEYGLTDWTALSLAFHGPLLPLVQGASYFANQSYLSAVQPAIGLTFCAVFSYFLWCSAETRAMRLLAVLLTVLLFTTYFVVFQLLYIHNSMPAALYLFTGTAALWFFRKEKNNHWLIVAGVALSAFGITRTESALFLIVMLALFARYLPLPLRRRVYLPILLFQLLWYLAVVLLSPGSSILMDTTEAALILAALTGFTVVVLSPFQWVEDRLVSSLTRLTLTVLVLSLACAIAIQPAHMIESAFAIFLNLYIAGDWWNLTWVFALFLLLLPRPADAGTVFFPAFIASFVLLLLFMAITRTSYRVGWGDSANRMLTHLLPVILFYGFLKIQDMVPARVQVKA